MEALVMMQWLISQPPEAQDSPQQDDSPKRSPLKELLA